MTHLEKIQQANADMEAAISCVLPALRNEIPGWGFCFESKDERIALHAVKDGKPWDAIFEISKSGIDLDDEGSYSPEELASLATEINRVLNNE